VQVTGCERLVSDPEAFSWQTEDTIDHQALALRRRSSRQIFAPIRFGLPASRRSLAISQQAERRKNISRLLTVTAFNVSGKTYEKSYFASLGCGTRYCLLYSGASFSLLLPWPVLSI